MAIASLRLRLRDKPDGHVAGAGAGDRAHDLRAVAVVLGVVGGVDVALVFSGSRGEGDVQFGPAGPDTAGAAGDRATVPRIARPVSRADVQAVTSPHNPHRHVR